MVFALAAQAALIALATLLVKREPVPIAGFDIAQRQGAETALYLGAFAVVMPLAAVLTPRLTARVAAGPNARGLPVLVALLSVALIGALGAVRLVAEVGVDNVAASLAVSTFTWAAVAASTLARAARPSPWRALLAAAPYTAWAWAIAGAALVLAPLIVTSRDSLSLPAAALWAVVIAAFVVAGRRWAGLRLPRRAGVAVDVLIVALLLLAVPDLVGISPDRPDLTLTDRIVNSVVRFHADFLLGPTNQLLGGGTMLVDTSSQYGVGSIYSLAAWFLLQPIGYGTLSLYDGVVTALFFASGYAVVRLAGVSRPLAAFALAVGVILLVFNREYPVGTLLQEGPLRFGLPMLLIVAAVGAVRCPRAARPLAVLALAVIGVSSVWAFEALAYTLATAGALAAYEAWLRPEGTRLRWLARWAAFAGVACLTAHVVLAAATLARTGQLPEWGRYLSLIRDFLTGPVGRFTYDFSLWSPGLAIGAAYLAGATVLVALAQIRPDYVRSERVAMLALVGLTTYGAVMFSYFVNRSADQVVAYVSLPALLAGALWLHLVRGRWDPTGRRAAVTLALGLALLVVPMSVAWSSIGSRFDRSALGHVLPGGNSTGNALERLRDFPPIEPLSPRGEQLVRRYWPGRDSLPIVVTGGLSTEILVRSGYTNQLRIADPVGESYVPEPRLPDVRSAVKELRPGDRMLLDAPALAELSKLARRPGRFDPLDPSLPVDSSDPVKKLQLFALDQIARRFRARPIHSDRDGFVVVELAPR